MTAVIVIARDPHGWRLSNGLASVPFKRGTIIDDDTPTPFLIIDSVSAIKIDVSRFDLIELRAALRNGGVVRPSK